MSTLSTASSTAPTIAITGATGQLGRLVIAQLLAQVPAARVVALARHPAKATDLGVAVREADYNRPETLSAALAGVQTLLLISSSEVGQRTPQHRAVIEAARAAGVGRIVYTSLLHADTTTLSLAQEHLATEEMIKASGLAYTLLRNSWYLENHTVAAKGSLAAGAFIGSAGTGRISGATRADYAAAAVAVLTSTGHEGKTYELAGDVAYTLSDVAAEIGRQAGHELPYRDLPVAAHAGVLTSIGLPEWLAQALAAWDFEASKDVLFNDSRTLSRLIGRPTTTLAQAVAQALA